MVNTFHLSRLLFLLALYPSLCKAQFITHGPVVGGVTPSSARMFVRTHQAQLFTIELSTDTAFSNPLTFTDSTRTHRDTSIITDLSGLAPYTTYYYRLIFNSVPDSLQGFFKTFPEEGQPGNYTWAVLSCQEYGTYNTFPALQTHQPELVLHTGDWTYPDYQIPGDHRIDWGLLQQSYRKRYSEPNMPAVLRSSVFDYVVDNHDGIGQLRNTHYVSSFVDSAGRTLNVVTLDPTPAGAFENMMNAYAEYFPNWPLEDSTKGMYHSYRYGNAEVFFVDVRNCGSGMDSTFTYNSATRKWAFAPAPGQTLLGAEQLQWLKNGLAQSDADWKFIVSGIMFNKKFKRIVDFGMFLQNTRFTMAGVTGTGFTLAHAIASNWCGYPREQNDLLHFLDSAQVKDVIVLSGHVHTNVMDNGSNAGLPELNTGPTASTGPELTYYIDSIMQSLGLGKAIDSLWNGGGHGVGNKNFKSGFGKIQIFGTDSVVLCTIDEDNLAVSCMTIKHSSKITSLSLPEQQECAIDKIFPNPASSGSINVQFCSGYHRKQSDQIFLIDVSGKVYPLTLASNNSVNVEHLSSGAYLLAYDYGEDVFVDYITIVR